MRYYRLDKVLRYLRVRKARPYIPRGSVLCDLGCGNPPELLLGLRGYIKKGIGIDKDIDVDKYRSSDLELHKDFVPNTIGLENEQCETITMLAVLEHLGDPFKILSETNRVLKRGGRVIITVPTRRNKPMGEFLSYKLGLINPEAYNEHEHYFTKESLEGLLVKTGFKMIKSEYWELGMNLLVVGEKS